MELEAGQIPTEKSHSLLFKGERRNSCSESLTALLFIIFFLTAH